MREYLVEISKYGIMTVMLIYTAGSFLFYLPGSEKKRSVYIFQSIFLFLTQLMLFFNLAVVSRDMQYVFFYVFVQIFLLASLVMIPMIYEGINRMLLNNMCMLIGTGLFIISRLSLKKAIKQYIIVMVSLALAFLIPYLFSRIRFLRKLTWVYGLAGTVLLSIVLFLGEVTHGSKISFTVFENITFQPSEFVKIIFVFFLAGALWEKRTFGRVALTAAAAGLHVVILVLSKDLGSALIFFVGYVFIVFVSTGNFLYLLAGAAGGGAAAYAGYLLFDHVKARVEVWQNPWAYIDGKGWAVTQSLFAMGSGSWFGMGIMNGNPDSIPYVDQDFVFSAICEELGVIFGLCLILIMLSCFLNTCKIAMAVGDRFYQLIVYGIGIMYIFQIFLTVGGGMNLIPLTGVTLPFISYGGSSCMTTMILFFIVQGIYIRMQQEERRIPAGKEEQRQKEEKASAGKEKRLQGEGKTPAGKGKRLKEEKASAGKEKRRQEEGEVPAGKGAHSGRKPKGKRAGEKSAAGIVVSSVLFAALFLFMGGFLVRFVVGSEQDMVNNSYNSRQEILLSRNYRGTVFSRDGEVLAETVMDAAQNETRVYPYENLFSHVVGYSTNGRMGVEAQANYYLINTHTSIGNKVANDMAGLKNPGDNVYTTLDVRLQEVADKQLGLYRGAVILTEVSTGKILAMVSHPDFDPNEIADIWDSLLADDSSTVLLNRVTQGMYPPGSTFKIVTALEYIRENPDTYQDYQFNCTGHFGQGDSRISCYHGTRHGKVDFRRSLAVSCNSSFANIGMTLDRAAFADTLKELLFNGELPLTMNYSKGRISVSEDMSDAMMIQTSFGQGETLMTPIHLNMITCAAANGGVLMKPYVVDRVENDAGSIVKAFHPQTYGSLMTEEESAILRELMTAVVEEGNAEELSGLSYTAAGKTGSAEYNSVKGDSHAWFTGFAPAENPEVCVTVIVEGAGSGGDYAIPIAKRMFNAYFEEKQLRIPED